MLRNTNQTWGSLARFLHWLTALMILGMFAYGLYIGDFVPREERGYHFMIHASVGISLLVLMLVRLVWRFMNPTPLPPAGSSPMEILAARWGHIGLYVLAIGAMIAGWLAAGSGRNALEFYLFGAVPMTSPLGQGSPYHGFAGETHEFLVYALIALTVVHVAAAIWHKHVRKDDVVSRMTTGRTSA